jgi:DNA mismatch endonuclease (patch repair protein)
MTDNLTPEDRQRTMRAVKGKGTKLERQLFSMLAGMRLSGWRKNASDVAGKPDVVFDNPRVAIFVDGCFWHGCPLCQRKLPQTNQEYWKQKINRNVERAELYNTRLATAGWIVIRIWEHEIKERDARQKIRFSIHEAIRR